MPPDKKQTIALSSYACLMTGRLLHLIKQMSIICVNRINIYRGRRPELAWGGQLGMQPHVGVRSGMGKRA